jgi:hypothetical protein
MKKYLIFVLTLLASFNCFAKWDMSETDAMLLAKLIDTEVQNAGDNTLNLNEWSTKQYETICVKNIAIIRGKSYKLEDALNSKIEETRKYFGNGQARARSCIVSVYNYLVLMKNADENLQAQTEIDRVSTLNAKLKKFLDSAPKTIDAGDTGLVWGKARGMGLDKYERMSSALSNIRSSGNQSNSGHGGVRNIHRFEHTTKQSQVECNDGLTDTIYKMDSGEFHYGDGGYYKSENAAAEARCR